MPNVNINDSMLYKQIPLNREDLLNINLIDRIDMLLKMNKATIEFIDNKYLINIDGDDVNTIKNLLLNKK